MLIAPCYATFCATLQFKTVELFHDMSSIAMPQDSGDPTESGWHLRPDSESKMSEKET